MREFTVSPSEVGEGISDQLGRPLPAVRWLLGKNCFGIASCCPVLRSLVSQIMTRASPLTQGPTRVVWIMTENGSDFVSAAVSVQGVHGRELYTCDSHCCFDKPLKGLLLLVYHTVMPLMRTISTSPL